jgi:ubiquinone/menaquinone biosynthesis C-methylase UbiE
MATPTKGFEETVRTQERYDRQARLFDLTEAPVELLLFRRLRRRLWGQVGGKRVLEVGVGTGKNIPFHPTTSRIVSVDVSPGMLGRAVSRSRRMGREIDLVLADAQHLPFRDAAFDEAGATFVFCSVPDAVRGLKEVGRVVRPDGPVHLLEHVRAKGGVVGWLMDLLNPLAVRISGANINRDTVSNVERAGIRLNAVESRFFGIVKLIRGAAGGEGGQRDRHVEA